MLIQKTFVIRAPADDVWQILGPNFARTADWASSVYFSCGRSDIECVEGAPTSGRICQTKFGRFVEEIVHFDDADRTVAFTAQSTSMPSFVKQITNTWSVKPYGDNRAEVTLSLRADLQAPFNFLLGTLMKSRLNTMLNEARIDLTHFAETGEAHPRNGNKKPKARRGFMPAPAAMMLSMSAPRAH